MSNRNRASGWQYAKLTGHSNEEAIEIILREDVNEQKSLLSKIKKNNKGICSVEIGGKNEKNVESIYPNQKTKSKTDLSIGLSDGEHLNISIKKSLGGQVYLIKDDRFINGFETHYDKVIPQDIKRAIKLFWGSAQDTKNIIEKYSSEETITYEKRKNRLVASTIYKYDKQLYDSLITWFAENSYEITDFCFSKGLAKNPKHWANWIWYKNLIEELDVDEIFSIESICNSSKKVAEKETYYGTRSGGTTIQLPFGFVQWHQGQMQFHHSFDKICSLNNTL